MFQTIDKPNKPFNGTRLCKKKINCHLVYVTVVLHFLGIQAEQIFVKRGSSLTLQCPYNSTTKPVIWRGPPSLKTISIDDSLNSNTDKFDIVSNELVGEYNLQINDFQTDDEGLYQCDTVLDGLPVDYDINVIVAVPLMNLSIVNETTAGIVSGIEGQPLQLICRVEQGNPVPNISLSYEDTILDSNISFTIRYEIVPRQDQHMKYFKCIADNTLYKLAKKVQLLLELKPHVELFAIPSSTVDEGQSIKLVCKNHTEIYIRNITWKYNGLIIPRRTLQEIAIENIVRKQSGNYSCHAVNHVGFGSGELRIQVQYKPYGFKNKTKYNIETKLGQPTDIVIFIESFPEPNVAWMSNPGGKLGFWSVTSQNATLYKICSTVLADQNDHFGVYQVRVRNLIGSLDLMINIIGYSVTTHPDSVVCKMSSTIKLSCVVKALDVGKKQSIWRHTYNGKHIRTLNGSFTGNKSVLIISFCDHRDDGNYTCIWMFSSKTYAATSFVSVYDRPIETGQEILVKDENLIFRIMFYSIPIYKEILWFFRDKIMAFTNGTTVKRTVVMVNNYGRKIDKPGYISILKMEKLVGIQFSDFSCQIRNIFGILETSFKDEDIIERTVSNTETFDRDSTPAMTTTERYVCNYHNRMCTTSAMENDIDRDDSLNGNVYIITIAAVTGILVVSMLIIIINQVKIMNNGTSRTVKGRRSNRVHAAVEERFLHTITETEQNYDDVEDEDYQEVEWRNYSFDTTARLSYVSTTITLNEPAKAYEEIQTTHTDNSEYSYDEDKSSKSSMRSMTTVEETTKAYEELQTHLTDNNEFCVDEDKSSVLSVRSSTTDGETTKEYEELQTPLTDKTVYSTVDEAIK